MNNQMAGLESVEVDGESYQLGLWTVDKSMDILVWLAKRVGGPIGTMMAVGASSGTDKDKLDASLDAMLGPAIQGALADLTPQDIKQHMRSITGEDILVGGTKVDWNIHYRRKTGHMFKVARAVLEYQYDDFLGELLSVSAGMRNTAESNQG